MSLANLFLTPEGKPSTYMSKKLTWTLLWCGTIALCLGGYLIIREQQALAVEVKTTGTVSENVLVADGRHGSISYHPKVVFVDNKGASITFQSNSGFSPALYAVGDIVPVLYNPANPNEAEINSFAVIWFPIILCFFIGTVFLGFGWRRVQKQKFLSAD